MLVAGLCHTLDLAVAPNEYGLSGDEFFKLLPYCPSFRRDLFFWDPTRHICTSSGCGACLFSELGPASSTQRLRFATAAQSNRGYSVEYRFSY
jgi:hypothetical protein